MKLKFFTESKKYIRIYEDNQFKEYIVYVNEIGNKPMSLAILKVLDIIGQPNRIQEIKTERLFIYDFTINQEIDISEENNVDSQYIFLIEKRIKFQSDNYQDCLDYLELLKKASKFNL